MTEKLSVALIGAGSMGGALLRGWLSSDIMALEQSAVFDPAAGDELKSLARQYGFSLNPDPSSIRCEAMVVAVKPQLAESELAAFTAPAASALNISVMAGKSISAVSKALGGAARVARVMPNLPASIGKGVTGLFAPDAVDENGRRVIERLMSAVGDIVWVDDERGIDFVTAVSGSGPAYFFLLTEALAEAGRDLGLDDAAAEKLARATLIGTGALLSAEERSAAEMREAVTSPGGTTEAALKILDGDGRILRKNLKQAVESAAKRASELTD